MAKKRFKIGEACIGGIIDVEIRMIQIKVSCKEWNSLKLISTQSYDSTGDFNQELMEYLEYLTTYYHADRIFKWIDKNKL